ncbi:uncharacterized protein LOC120995092 isoform X3 [Bufo bufo]|uniref:uncharacterized protein LOC120995092 isoform X3 n=1 Tax=Bufo bufo TaxID=8384 RepID=UPI001ABE5665|nr:uncharacterized protein LOC120995092 isoform X3 [Bufo bufo]
MLATSFGIIFLISMALCVFAEDCLVKISGEHQILKNMISTQGYFCSIYVRILKKEQVSDYCDLLALVYEVDGLLETLKFIDGTDNYKSKNSLLRTVSPCIEGLDYTTQNAVNGYLQAENMNPIEILQRVNNSLHKLDGFQADSESSSKCESYYKEQQPSNNGTKERSEDEGKKEPRQSNQQLITNVVLVVLVLLFLSGFLYYMHLYRVLKRRLAVSHDLHLPRNLSTVSSEEMMRLSTTECSNV